MKKLLNILLLSCFLVFIQCSSQPPPGKETGLKTVRAIEKHEFAQLLSEVRQQNGIPGIAAVLVSSKGILNIGVDGVCRIDKPAKLEISHRFHIGSNTKALTGLLAGIMVNKKLIRWDTGFFKLFPGLKKDAKEVYHNITLKDLLCHQARIRPFMQGYEFARLPEFQGTVPGKRKAFAAWLVQQEPVEIDPGKGYAYSNAGYAMAAAMLEKVSGQSWEELLQKELFEPLELTGKIGWPAHEDKSQPWGHYIEDNGTLTPHDPDDEYQIADFARPAGDVNMSIRDYAVYLQVFLKGLKGEDTLVPAETIKYLLYCNMGKSEYHIGWGSRKIDGYTYSIHNGSAGTFFARAAVIKELDLAAAIFVSSASPGAQKGARELMDKLGGFYIKK